MVDRWNQSLRSTDLFVKMLHSKFAICSPSANNFQDLLLGIQITNHE